MVTVWHIRTVFGKKYENKYFNIRNFNEIALKTLLIKQDTKSKNQD